MSCANGNRSTVRSSAIFSFRMNDRCLPTDFWYCTYARGRVFMASPVSSRIRSPSLVKMKLYDTSLHINRAHTPRLQLCLKAKFTFLAYVSGDLHKSPDGNDSWLVRPRTWHTAQKFLYTACPTELSKDTILNSSAGRPITNMGDYSSNVRSWCTPQVDGTTDQSGNK